MFYIKQRQRLFVHWLDISIDLYLKLAEENHSDIQDAACQEPYVCKGSENASVDRKDSSIEQNKDVVGISSQNQGNYNYLCYPLVILNKRLFVVSIMIFVNDIESFYSWRKRATPQ